MLTLPRSAALRFRLMLKRAVMLDAHRQTWPVVVCRAGRGELTLEAGQGGFAVRLAVDASGGSGAITFRGDLLTKVEARDDTPVTLEPAGPGRAVARWADGGVPQAAEFETVPPEDAPAFPAEPPLTAMPESFLAALADAIRTAAKQHVRAGLTRVLFRGKGGEVVASDSKQLLVQRGYPFPWEGDVLVPRVPALDGRPLDVVGPVGLGRTAEQVIIRVAPWAFALPVDAVNPFPAIDAVIPRATAATGRLRLDPGDAARLEAVLPRLPGAGDDQAPVTLALDRRVAVRARGVSDPRAVEVVLEKSSADGPPVMVATDRAYLLRALALGFTELQAGPGERPVVCRDRRRIYLWMPLETAAVVPPGPGVRQVPLPDPEASNGPPRPVKPKPHLVTAPVPAPIDNGHQSVPGPAESPPRVTVGDVIGEAVTVAGLLRDAAGRVTRLAAALRRQRGQTRAVQVAVRSLQQLQLDH